MMNIRSLVDPKGAPVAIFRVFCLMGGNTLLAQAAERGCSVDAYEIYWSGQFAGFIVNGRFSYNARAVPANGILREQDLLALDVSFYDPEGNLLRTYADNQRLPIDDDGRSYLNFAFDPLTKRLLHKGTWHVDDDNNHFRNGVMMGEGSPALAVAAFPAGVTSHIPSSCPWRSSLCLSRPSAFLLC